jgi:hypothetical protein
MITLSGLPIVDPTICRAMGQSHGEYVSQRQNTGKVFIGNENNLAYYFNGLTIQQKRLGAWR